MGHALATELVARYPCREEETFDRLPLELIDAKSDQPRRIMNTPALDELTESVREHGVLQPIRVRRRGARYEIVAGHRRAMAARRAGLTEIPAIVVTADDRQALVEALVENIQREDLNPVERGEALRLLRVNLGAHSWEEVGRVLGISRRHVYHLLNVAELPEPIREDIQAGNVSEKHGRALMRLRNEPDLQMQLWRRITAERMSGDEALSVVRDLVMERRAEQGQIASGSAAADGPTPFQQTVEQLLRLLPRATMREIRPLRSRLESLAKRLSDVLVDAFYEEEEEMQLAGAGGGDRLTLLQLRPDTLDDARPLRRAAR